MTTSSIPSGQQLGSFVVLRPLGSGGMGDVYLAWDTRLDREVALKLLPPEVSRDPERLARFRQEALALAALNHPNIAILHGLEEPSAGSMFLVMERIEGETLGARLGRGKLALEEALRVCAQVAEALEVAHERHLVHRDLKPGNVMLGPRGIVKVLDFGLAQSRAGASKSGAATAPEASPPPEASAAPPPPAGGDATMALPALDASTVALPPLDAPTVAMPALDAPTVSLPPLDAPTVPLPVDAVTQAMRPVDTTSLLGPPGIDAPTMAPSSASRTVLGTPGYMSPEQVRGQPEDERSDVFAFGSLLFECLSGERAFRGDSLLDILQATLDEEVDLARLPRETPGRVRELLGRCLEKDVERRLAVIRDARIEIEEALGIRRASALRSGETLAVTPNNLPQNVSSFVGRSQEVEDCAALLETTRLLTLTGVGGSGKSRLALHVAESRMREHPDGVWFVDLSPLTEGERVPLTVAAALGVREEAGRPLVDSLVEHLRPRRALLMLDGCEHLVESSADLAKRLLTSCPELTLLATSREPLGIVGEAVHGVPSLTVPREGLRGGEARFAAFESVRLFVERARLVQPKFELSDDNAPVVGEICRRLDGIPLAIELAAARAKVLSVDQIRAKLDDRFRLLTGGGRDALPRHQTLRAAMEWSYDQLTAEEQSLLRHLSVFAGGWSLNAAASVCADDGDEFEILDGLSRLVDKSLVVVDRQLGEDLAHYRYLETVRHYALERLGEAGGAEVLRARHVDFYVAEAEQAESRLVGPEEAEWLRRIDLDRENYLSALAWCAKIEGGASRGLRLAASLSRYWSTRGFLDPGRRSLADALRLPGAEAPTKERATALVRAAALDVQLGHYTAAQPLVEESIELYRQFNDRKGVARGLALAGTVAACLGDWQRSRACNAEAAELYGALGEKRGVAQCRHNLGYVTMIAGDPAEARPHYERAIEILRGIGDRKHVALSLADLGMADARRGDFTAAAAGLAECLRIVQELEAQREAAYAMESASELAFAIGELGRAARYQGIAEGIRQQIGSPPTLIERNQNERRLQALRERYGVEECERELATGRETARDIAVADALDWLNSTVRGAA